MKYIPHTAEDIDCMLKTSEVENINNLFSSIPDNLRLKHKLELPEALSEHDLRNHISKLAAKNTATSEAISFLGAGSYKHYIPSAVDAIASRSEWLTPYTPYQPEISQGTLQAIFEYQTMICNLTGMQVTNASHYDGATATAEAALMVINKKKQDKILVASTLHPEYRDTIECLLKPKNKKLVQIQYSKNGQLDLINLKSLIDESCAGIIVQNPNFFGTIEDLQAISQIAKDSNIFFIVTIPEPISLGILKNPGDFGADIVTAEGQAFGVGLNFGGPYLGILATTEKLLRTMPGRVSGQTEDIDGKKGFVLTMSTREQHIRRERATSNICSNEALMALRAAIYLSLLGKNGLKKLAEINMSNAQYLRSRLSELKNISIEFEGPCFNEFVINVHSDTNKLNEYLLKEQIFGGVPLECWYPELKECMLVCTTECHTKDDLDKFVDVLGKGELYE